MVFWISSYDERDDTRNQIVYVNPVALGLLLWKIWGYVRPALPGRLVPATKYRRSYSGEQEAE